MLCYLLNFSTSVSVNPYIFYIRQNILKFHKNSTNNSIIQLIWIPAHSGIQGNEKADCMAKHSTTLTADCEFKIPFTDLKMNLKSRAVSNTLDIITEEGTFKGVQYFNNFHNNITKPWFFNLKLPRKVIVTINRCRSGHYNLKSSLFKIGLCKDTICECNHEYQDLDHILWQCPLYNNQRYKFVENIRSARMFLPSSSTVLLANINVKIAKSICNFLTDCNLSI